MRLLRCVAVFLMLTLAAPLMATTVRRLTLDELVAKASSIVIGRVIDSHAFRTEDRKLILTNHTVEVQQSLKGRSGQTIVVTTIGGNVGDSGLRVAGMPELQTGETAVLFLEQSGRYTTVVGLKQGEFSISNGQVQGMVGGLSSPENLSSPMVRMSLGEFLQQIQIRIGK